MIETDVITRDEAKALLQEHIDILRYNIHRLLKEKKITQTELAMRIDVSKSYLNTYILRHPCPKPQINLIIIIANKLGVHISELFKKMSDGKILS